MTGQDVLTGPAADRVRETWVEFSSHARACPTCVEVLASLLKDPIQKGRHTLYGRCCEPGATLYGGWDVAVSAMVDHLSRVHADHRPLIGAQA